MANNRPPDEQNYRLLPELDGAILAVLPEEGAKIGGFRPSARQVKHIVQALRKVEEEQGVEPSIETNHISPRMRILAHHGYAVGVDVTPVGSGKGWQRTPAGRDFARQNAGELMGG